MTLKELYERIQTKKSLEEKLSSLYPQKKDLELKVKRLYDTLLKEEKDVERLEKGGLSTKLFGLTGKLNQRKEKEENEAYQAKVNYQTSSYQLEVLKQDIESFKKELKSLEYSEKTYQKRLDFVYDYVQNNSIESSIMDEYQAYMDQFGPVEETMNMVKESRKLVSTLRKKLKELDNHNMEDMLGNDYASVEYENHKNKTNVLNDIKSLCTSLQENLQSLSKDIKHTNLSIEISDEFIENDFLEIPFSSFSTIKLIGKLLDQLLDIALELKTLEAQLEEPYANGILKKERLYQQLENFLMDYDENHPGLMMEETEAYDESRIKVLLREGNDYLNLLKELLNTIEAAQTEAGEDVFRKKSLLAHKHKYDSFEKVNQKVEEVEQALIIYRQSIPQLSIEIPLRKMDVSKKTQDYVFDFRGNDYQMFKDIQDYRLELEKRIEILELELTQLDEKIYH